MRCVRPERLERACFSMSLLCMLCGTATAAILGVLADRISDHQVMVMGAIVYVCFGIAFLCSIVILVPQLCYTATYRPARPAPIWQSMLPQPVATAPPFPECAVPLPLQTRGQSTDAA
jgi:hypothetical protein